MEWLLWFTKFENTKPISLVIFFLTFCGILWFVLGNKERAERLESYKNMPFHED